MDDSKDEAAGVDVIDDELIDTVSGARGIDADSILDSLVPQSIDWRETVSRHPVLSVVSVGLVGYLVGRTKGASIMAGITAGLSAGIMRQLSDVFEGDFFDF
ncbi:MAG: hypothetical protein ACC742_11660 [Thermoanaerobaculales bacterium]